MKSIRGGGQSIDELAAAVSMGSAASLTQSNNTGTTSPSSLSHPIAKAASLEPTVEKLGRFEIKQLLGEGGFGRVYRAYDPQLDRFVALKVPTFAATDRGRVKRFLTEARAAAQLRHPNIVPTFDSGQSEGKLYIASQFIDGQALNDRIHTGKVSPREAANWVAKLADAVHYAHEQGIVHRDIKPHNVMLDNRHEPQLMDFGLAKRLSEDSNVTVDGSLMGTPAYMSPEQARGDHANVGPASDQYSLGVMLYELLTGQKPFSGAPHMVVAQVLDKDPRTVRDHDPSIPKDLDAICQKAMSKQLSRRYTTAADLAQDLRCWLAGTPTKARTPSVIERGMYVVRRNPMTAALSSLLIASLVLGTIVSISFAMSARSESLRADERAEFADKQKALADENAKVAMMRADEAEQMALYTQAESALAQRRFREAHLFNREAHERANRWEYTYQLRRIVDACKDERRVVGSIVVNSRPLATRFIGSDRVLYQTEDGPRVYSLSLAAEVASLNDKRLWSFIEPFSSDEAAVVKENEIHIVNLNTLASSKQLSVPYRIKSIKVAPLSKRLAILDTDGVVHLLSGELSEVASKQLKIEAEQFSMSLSPSGTRFFYQEAQNYQTWDVEKDVFTSQFLAGYHQSLFGTTDDQIFSLSFLRAPATEIAVKYLQWQGSRLVPAVDNYLAKNLVISGNPQSLDFALTAKNDNKFDVTIGLMFDTAYNLFRTDAPNTGKHFELLNLWPQSTASVSFMAQSVANRLIAIHADDRLLIMQVASNRDIADLPAPGLQTYPTAFWSFDASDSHVYSYNPQTGLVRSSYEGEKAGEFRLQQPPAASGLMVTPWGFSVTSDDSKLALLWQENDSNGMMNSKYYRKLIATYDLPMKQSSEEVKFTHVFNAENFSGSPGRSPRWLKISSDGSKIIFGCRAEGEKSSKTDVIDIATNQVMHTIESEEYVVYSSDGQYFATYSMSQLKPIKVYSITQPDPVFSIDPPSLVQRLALSRDNSEIMVGLQDHRIDCYRIGESRAYKQLQTAAAPIISLPGNESYIGFVPESGNYGRLVHARFADGRIVDVLDRNFWYAQGASCSLDGRGVSFLSNRNLVAVIHTTTQEKAKEELERVVPRSPATQ